MSVNAKLLADELENAPSHGPWVWTNEERDLIVKALRSYVSRESIIEECAKVCDETAALQSAMAQEADEDMARYRKARAWDASVCAAKIRELKSSLCEGGEGT